MNVEDIREAFADELEDGNFVIDKFGGRVIELIGVSFLADSDAIFGTPNLDYIQREIEWYNSRSLRVDTFPGGPAPKIWQDVASKTGFINSNYGYLLYDGGNFNQYSHVVEKLKKSPLTRQAIAIYTRPTMHYDWCTDGMCDFACTNTVQYLIRDHQLHVVVNMRSNDAWAGFRNDRHWQSHVQHKMVTELRSVYPELQLGDITWQVGSLHVYDRQFYLVDHYIKTGEIAITKKQYRELYPESPLGNIE